MGIRYQSVIEAPIEEVWDWHTRRGAIHRLTPPWQPLKVLAEADSLKDGRAELVLPGGLKMVAQHDPEAYEPPREFVDELLPPSILPLPSSLEQRIRPWRHRHLFEPLGKNKMRMTDDVRTPAPARALRTTFAYRHRQLAADIAALQRSRQWSASTLTVAVTGASGLIGNALCALLTTSGHRVVRLVRGPAEGPAERHWDVEAPDPQLLAGVDGLVHLAGASIAGRFDGQHMEAIRSSRIEPTRKLAQLAAAEGLGVFVCASAIGYYGASRPGEELTENSERGNGFLADVVADWEQATEPASEAGVRTVLVRTGIVQSPRGGLLRMLLPVFKAGLGGRLGSGDQTMSWIGIDDLTDIYLRVLLDGQMSGPVNAVAPQSVDNRTYARTLAKILHRPAILPTPEIGPRLILGREGADELALADQRVIPAVLIQRDHHFRADDLEGALRHMLGRA